MKEKHLTQVSYFLALLAASTIMSCGDGGDNEGDTLTNSAWNRTFGGAASDEAYSVAQTLDGGHIVAGSTASYGAGSDDVWLIKTDANGNEQWNKTFGGAGSDGAHSVVQTLDGGYIVAGSTASFGVSAQDIWLIKTDANGNEQWNKTFGGCDEDLAWSVAQTRDKGYIVAGWTRSYGAGAFDAWLIKTDLNGNEQWNKTFGGHAWDYANSVGQTTDGGYIVAGWTWSYSVGANDVWLIKIDTNGNEQWNKTFGGHAWDYGYSVVQTTDGGFIVAGSTGSYGAGSNDVWLIKTDTNGNGQWNKTFGGIKGDGAYSVAQTTDGGFIVAGRTMSYSIGSLDVWLIKTDASGETCDYMSGAGQCEGGSKWVRTFGICGLDEAYSVVQTTDGGYIVTGRTVSCGAGDNDVWLIKTDANGNAPLKP